MLESFLIFISIVGAFWLENIRDEQKNKNARMEYLVQLKRELLLDIDQFESLKRSTTQHTKNIDQLVALTKAKNPDPKQLAILIHKVEGYFLDASQYDFIDHGIANEILHNKSDLFGTDSTFFPSSIIPPTKPNSSMTLNITRSIPEKM